MHILRNNLLSCVERLSLFTLVRFLLIVCLFSLGRVTVSGSERTIGPEADIRKVNIRKNVMSAQDMPRGKTEEIFTVEVIRDRHSLEKGLSEREDMPERNGMLFVLDAKQEYSFWMKGMRFPLDIIFIGRDMRVTEILENLQPCAECPIYFPKLHPAYVLEINAGLSRKYGLSVGDTMEIEK